MCLLPANVNLFKINIKLFKIYLKCSFCRVKNIFFTNLNKNINNFIGVNIKMIFKKNYYNFKCLLKF